MNFKTKQDQANTHENVIFLSWSGVYSKKIASQLKISIEHVFDHKITCFFSDKDISSGALWYKEIQNELQKSSMGIMCITKENVKAPWIFFFFFSLVGNDVRIVPLLINCDQKSLKETPINANQSVQFYNQEKFRAMLYDIRKEFKLYTHDSKEKLDPLFDNEYTQLRKRLKKTLDELKRKRFFNEKSIFPNDVHTVTKDTIYISAPMDSLPEEEYAKQHEFLSELKTLLKENLGFKDVYCPALKVVPGKKFDGVTKSVKENFRNLRQIENLIVIYPKKLASSVLVEIGYCISLSKSTVIFYREGLPFMLRGAGEDIVHLHTRQFKEYDDILEQIEAEGKELFEVKDVE